MEITVTSSGGAAEHQPNRLGTFTVAGTLWENLFPFWKSTTNPNITTYITLDPNSNPIIYYLRWVIVDDVGGINGGGKNIFILS